MMRRSALLPALLLLLASACGGGSAGSTSDGGPDVGFDIGLDTAHGDGDGPSLDGRGGDAPGGDIPSADGPGADGPPPTLWPGFDEPPPVAGGWFAAHPALADFLVFAYHLAPGAPRPDASHLGDFAVGNGRTFALLGLTFPLNTLHGQVGPTYSRRDRAYGDLAVRLGDANGAAVDFEEEWIGAPRRTPVVVSAGRRGDLFVAMVDFAPLPAEGETPRAAHASVWRRIRVENRGSGPSAPASLVVTASLPPQVDAGALVERRQDGRRVVFFRGGAASVVDRRLVLPVAALAAGNAVEVDLVVATAAPDAAAADVVAALADEDPNALLTATTEAYQSWEDGTTQVDTPDPVVDDTFVNLRRTLWVQVSAQGASSPMSRYAMTWTRDLSGVVRPLAALGAQPLAARVLDYYYAVAAAHGALVDAYEADEEVDWENAPAVDWAALPEMTGKAAAEGPSHLPLMYAWLLAASGDTSRAAERIAYLRHAIDGQQWTEELLQPFSGDETYRGAMNVAFGLDIEYPHHERSWSVCSGLLLAAAARAQAGLEDAAGDPQEAARFAAFAEAVAEATRTRFALPDGCLAAYIDRETGALSPPYEDALLNGPWAGPPWDDAAPTGNGAAPERSDADGIVDCLMRRVRSEPGAFLSPAAPGTTLPIVNLPIEVGVYSGMLPGYTLRALAMTGHPEAEAAFNLLRRSMSPSGNYAEYMLADDHSALEPLYEASGGISDFTARYRPWEGGINLEALFHYLTGYEPDALRGRLRLRPHLPNDWPELRVDPIVVGASRIALAVRRDGEGLRVDLSHRAGPAIDVTVVFDALSGVAPDVTLGGAAVPAADLTVERSFGTAVVTLPPCTVSPASACAIAAQPAGP